MTRITIESTYTTKEEFIHSFLHGIGVAFGIIAIPYLLWIAAQTGNRLNLASTCIYAFGFLMTFTFSTLYHGAREGRLKAIFQLLDHISIYVLIAGTYTPLIVKYMYNDKGLLLLTIVWLCSFIGIILKIFFPGKFRFLAVCLYLITGLMFLLVSKSFFSAMPVNVIVLIGAGAALYLVGVTFYLFRQWKYHHATWHLLTLVAGVCHFAAVVLTFR